MIIPIKLKIKIALKGILGVMKNPLYVLGSIAVGFITLGIILWSLNTQLLWYIVVEAPINFAQKLEFVTDVYGGIATNYESTQSMIMLLFSFLFGVNIMLIVFVVRNGAFKLSKNKSSVGGLTAAIIGGGCIACGTSIITPIIASFGATATISLNNTVGTLVNTIGIVFILYSLLGLGQLAATILSQEQH